MSGGDVTAARPLLQRLWSLGWEASRYLAASVAALGLDVGLLWLLTERAGWHYLQASALSYSVGAILHYAISVTLVFRERVVRDRRLEFLGFFAIGLFGLAVNQLVLKAAVDGLGLTWAWGKVAAVGVSFVLTYLARRAALFTAQAAAR